MKKPQIQIPASRFVTHEIHVQGAQGYCWDFPIAIAAARDIPLEKFITHTFPLEQLQQALDTALDSKSGSIKVIPEAVTDLLQGEKLCHTKNSTINR